MTIQMAWWCDDDDDVDNHDVIVVGDKDNDENYIMHSLIQGHPSPSGLVTQFNPVSETHFSFSQVSNKPPWISRFSFSHKI